MSKRLVRWAALLWSLIGSVGAHAEISALPLPTDNRIVEFVYDENDMYTILTRPLSTTTVRFYPDEIVETVALGESARWKLQKSNNILFIRPTVPNISTTAAVVTNRRIYQLTLRSSPEDGKFYQEVRWSYPDLVVYQKQMEEAAKQAEEREKQRLEEITVTPGISIESLNFDYSISGEADFRPSQVFDDGKFTWLRMPNTQELPAIFMLDEKNGAELVNFNLRGQYVVIQRLVPRLMMKLGEHEIKISNNKVKRSVW